MPEHSSHTLQVAQGTEVTGICFNSPLEKVHRLLKIAALREQYSEIIAGIGVFGL